MAPSHVRGSPVATMPPPHVLESSVVEMLRPHARPSSTVEMQKSAGIGARPPLEAAQAEVTLGSGS